MMVSMTEPPALAAFLRARRERTSPRDVGLPVNGRRRTPGLRREEVATLAGVSVDYLVRLEQGRDDHPSAEVLVALADAMRMTEDERRHLFHLGAISMGAAMCPAAVPLVRDVAPTVVALLERLHPTPAFVLGPVGDVLAWNDAWAAVVGALGVLDDPQPNLARYVFLDPRSRDAFPAWWIAADEQVGRLRRAMTRWEADETVAELIAQLRTAPEFEVRWAAHPVDEKRRGAKLIAHPTVGDLDLVVEVLAVADDSEQVLVTWLPADDVTAARLDAVVAPPHLRVVGRG
jgi:transcriptional regulator with XRE-family HTH domain